MNACQPIGIKTKPQSKQLRLWTIVALLGLFLLFIPLELLLKMLPVNEGTYRLPVDGENPILRLQPSRQFTWSKGWDFKLVNDVTINNYGFVNDQDYDPKATTPLLAVIGDSYVEAMMVPFQDTISGRLASRLNKAGRVYSFGISGAPLSQYLAYSQYVSKTFHPDGMVIVVVGNDFDESLIKYKSLPGYHYFFEDNQKALVLKRVDYSPSAVLKIMRTSTLGRYLGINLEIQARLTRIKRDLIDRKDPAVFVGNTYAKSDALRVQDSKRAVDAFLDIFPVSSGLSPRKILFVVDGIRPHLYGEEYTLEMTQGSYFDLMREYFMQKAKIKDYEVIDMQPIFLKHYKQYGKRFDQYPFDSHWNALGHKLGFDLVVQSELFSRWEMQLLSVGNDA